VQWYRLPPDDLINLLPAVGMTDADLPSEPKLEIPIAS
jgi:hypothetical protein